MNQARNQLSVNTRLEAISRPYSFFKYLDNHYPNIAPLRPLKRILSQARSLQAQTMVVEELNGNDCVDILEENEDLEKICLQNKNLETIRISFFSVAILSLKHISIINNENFLGYVILKTDCVVDLKTMKSRKSTRVFESVIRQNRLDHNYIRGGKKWECRVCNKFFNVTGYIFAQQNGVTNVCAHASLRSVLSRYVGDKGASFRSMNDIIGIDHKTRKLEKGLNPDEIKHILIRNNINSFVYDYSEIGQDEQVPPYQRAIYCGIESGFPVIVVFDCDDKILRQRRDVRHAITIFGHTFNEDTWVAHASLNYFYIGPDTKYIPSDSWTSMFIGHDDNFGSNYCIPRFFLRQLSGEIDKDQQVNPSFNPDRVSLVISTFPEEVKLDPVYAEPLGVRFIELMLMQLPDERNEWGKRFCYYKKANLIIIRSILISRKQYFEHIKKIYDWDFNKVNDESLEQVEAALETDYYWMVEVSVPELFTANKRKLGEVLLRADKKHSTENDLNLFGLARIPGLFAYMAGIKSDDNDSPNYCFWQSGMDGHSALYGCEE